MSQQSAIPFKLYSIGSSPFAQPAFAICAVFRNLEGFLNSECFVLIQDSPTTSLAYGSRFSYSDNTDGDSPIVLDEAFALDDILHQAETMYSVKAQELDTKLAETLDRAHLNFCEIPQHRLVGIWAHTPLSQSLLNIASKSDCALLSHFIYSLRSLPTVEHTSLAL